MISETSPERSKDPTDPSRFFAVLGQEEPREEFWLGFWPSIRAGIREGSLRQDTWPSRGRALLLGSSAGVMVAAAILLLAFLVVPFSRLSVPTHTEGTVLTASSPRPGTVIPPVLEEVYSDSARVYTFLDGAEADAPDVIWIVDEQIDIGS